MKKNIIILSAIIAVIAGFIVFHVRFMAWADANVKPTVYEAPTQAKPTDTPEEQNKRIMAFIKEETDKEMNTDLRQNQLKTALKDAEKLFRSNVEMQVSRRINLLTVTAY